MLPAEASPTAVELPEPFVSMVSPTPERPFCAVCLETVDSNPADYQLSELGGGALLKAQEQKRIMYIKYKIIRYYKVI